MVKIKVLLTGASGTVGIDVFQELLYRYNDYEVSLFLRPSKKNLKHFQSYNNGNGIHIFWGLLDNYNDVERAVKNQDIIIHLAAVLPDIAMFDPELAKKTNIEGTQKIIRAMQKQEVKPKLIYTSSVALYGDRLKNPIIKISDELDINSDDIYAQTKLVCENLIKESGLEYSIFRLSYCASTHMLKMRPLMFHMPLDTKVEIIHTKDVAKALINAIEVNEVWGKTYNLAGGKRCQITFRENLNDILGIMGFGRNFFPEEAFAKSGFHCGYYDTTEMNENQKLLNFQNHTLEDFYSEVKKWIGFKRYLIPIVRPILRWRLLKKSKFYQEFKQSKKQSL
jgi:nucleoside-diphosphate-sugar epimerase